SVGLDRLSIRWRLALTSAGLTFVILAAFAIAVGQLTASRVRSDFQNEVAAAVDNLSDRIFIVCVASEGKCTPGGPNLADFAGPGNATIRILFPDGRILDQTKHAPNFGLIYPARSAKYGGLGLEIRKRPVKVVDPEGHRSRFLVPLVLPD